MKKEYNPLDEATPNKSHIKYKYALLALLLGLVFGYFFFIGHHPTTDPITPANRKTIPDPRGPKDDAKPIDPVNPEQPNEPIIQVETKTLSDFNIVKTYKRLGQQYYTQGLTFRDQGTLLESAGIYGESEVHYVNVEDMKVFEVTKNDRSDFGEGAEFFDNGNQIIQLTWRERNMHIYDAKSMKLTKTVKMPSQVKEGWGISRRDIYEDGIKVDERLYITDGTDSIHIMDPKSFEIIKTLKTFVRGKLENPWNLNELEFVEGKLWANVYLKTDIAIIDPDTGFVEAYFRVPELLSLARKEGGARTYGDCLNGIAYHPETKQLLLTGKKWPVMWQITVDGYAPGV